MKGQGSCEIWNKSDFCSAVNELLCTVSPSCGTFSFYLCFMTPLQQQWGLSIPHKIQLFRIVERNEGQLEERMKLQAGWGWERFLVVAPAWQLILALTPLLSIYRDLHGGRVSLSPLGSALFPRPCKRSGFIYKFIPWMVLPRAAEDCVV